ncbi:MAG: hypothetical protein ACYDBB_13780 [Armatimonadota bacterium]
MGIGGEGISDEESFKALRSEILAHYQAMSNFQLAAVTSTGVILGLHYAKAATDPLLLLVPLVIVIPFAFDFASRCQDICRIGTYIQVFLEEQRPGWETRMDQLMEEKRESKFPPTLNRLFYTATFPLIGVTSIGMSFCHLSSANIGERWIMLLVSIIGFILIIIATRHILFAFHPDRRKWHIEQWEIIRSSYKSSPKEKAETQAVESSPELVTEKASPSLDRSMSATSTQ